MKKTIIFIAALALPILLSAQQPPAGTTATIRITNLHIDLDGEKQDPPEALEVVLTDGVTSRVSIFQKDGIEYGVSFTYRKGKNRIKLVRRGYVRQDGMEPKNAKQKKDMQELRTSIPGSMNGRVLDNIVFDKENMKGISVSFNYELTYKQ